MIQIINACKILKGKQVLKNINLTLNEGECIAITGFNGCGKTMLLRLICGLIKPTSGEVKTDKDYSFGVIIENPTFFFYESALYNLKYLAGINKKINNDVIEEYLKKFNLYDVRNKKVSTFSLGMKQRLALCQAFMEDPDVILLDEPFNALDEENLKIAAESISLAKEKGKIIVIALHGTIPEECKIDKVIKMGEGIIVN
ncbi:MAG: ABC transporter ATP-binding protein [Clostridia bacterium]|nr:ABC transporter ATP-binding protein [Clostridia bacterium]